MRVWYRFKPEQQNERNKLAIRFKLQRKIDMKKLTLILTITLLFAAASSYAQEIETGKKGQMAILKLEFIVGNWVGTG